ncbi:MAG: SCP2 sterol-binding domain-containing protein [Myxococcota bacterium]|nr:SCP2 sterol-binding domain-containing protein [Myxococcota bacterium]
MTLEEGMPAISNAKEYFDSLGERFVTEEAKGLNASFHFELAGDDGGLYTVLVNDGHMEIQEGPFEEPTFTLKMKGEDYIKMAHGKLNGAMAFMTGKMKISGDRSLAQTMKKIFPIIK